MATNERILEVENITDEPIVETWDGVSYRFEPHAKVKLAYGLGLTFVERNPDRLVRVAESIGIVTSAVIVPVMLMNTDAVNTVTVMWDGMAYVFPPRTPVEVDRSLVPALVTQARVPNEDFPRGATLEVVDGSKAESPAPVAPVAAEAAIPTAKTVKAPRKSKKATQSLE